MAKTSHSNAHRKAWAFLAAQAVIVPVFVGVVWARGRSLENRLPELPAATNRPLAVPPEYDYPQVISDAQLTRVLHKLRPRLAGGRPKINHVDHALRFWGVEAEFDDEACLSGRQMRQLLLDHRAFAAAWGEKTRPLLKADDDGVAVRTQQGAATASHFDHTLATLAETGTPLDFPVVTPEGPTALRAVWQRAMLQFSLNQREYEWTALALALHAPSPSPWETREGQQVDFDLLARRIMRQGYAQGVCYGNHRLFTLAILLRVDQGHAILSAEARREVLAHLQEATRRLVSTQAREGYWDRNWADGKPVQGPDRFTPLARRVLATGHALEWWAMAPEEVHPPREVLVRAAQWLVVEIEKMTGETVQDYYTFLSHAGRALALWRGDSPAAWMARHRTDDSQS